MDCSIVSDHRFITVSEMPVIPVSVVTRTRMQFRKPRWTIWVHRSVTIMGSFRA